MSALRNTGADATIPRDADSSADLDHFRRRVLVDALTEALPQYWRRRGAAFKAVGTIKCDAIALACRHRADFIVMYGVGNDVLHEVDDALGEVA